MEENRNDVIVDVPETDDESAVKEALQASILTIMEQSYLKGFNCAIETISGVMFSSSFKESRPEVKRYMQTLALELSRMKMTEKDITSREETFHDGEHELSPDEDNPAGVATDEGVTDIVDGTSEDSQE